MAGQKDVAVPDADVLVPTLSCDLLLCAFECDLYRPVVTPRILGEFGHTLIDAFPHLDPAAPTRRAAHVAEALKFHTRAGFARCHGRRIHGPHRHRRSHRNRQSPGRDDRQARPSTGHATRTVGPACFGLSETRRSSEGPPRDRSKRALDWAGPLSRSPGRPRGEPTARPRRPRRRGFVIQEIVPLHFEPPANDGRQAVDDARPNV